MDESVLTAAFLPFGSLQQVILPKDASSRQSPRAYTLTALSLGSSTCHLASLSSSIPFVLRLRQALCLSRFQTGEESKACDSDSDMRCDIKLELQLDWM